jgi:hypothetical protein
MLGPLRGPNQRFYFERKPEAATDFFHWVEGHAGKPTQILILWLDSGFPVRERPVKQGLLTAEISNFNRTH